jgi:hypothetical protein
MVLYKIRFTECVMTPAELSEKLWDNAERVAKFLLPKGHLEGKEWCAGNTNGDSGKASKSISAVKIMG